MQSSRCSLSKKEVNDVEISILNAIYAYTNPGYNHVRDYKTGKCRDDMDPVDGNLVDYSEDQTDRSDPDAGAVRGCRALQWNPEESG